MAQFKVDAKDREYQFWKRNPLSIELRNHAVFRQKLDYIHGNPVKAGMCKLPEEYKYSSALFYETGVDNWGYLEHFLPLRVFQKNNTPLLGVVCGLCATCKTPATEL